jgi:hypothetical protein
MAQRPSTQPSVQRGRPKALSRHPQTSVLVVRVPEEMRRRLEAYVTRVQTAHPYLRLSRADVLRTLLDKGLSAEGA